MWPGSSQELLLAAQRASLPNAATPRLTPLPLLLLQSRTGKGKSFTMGGKAGNVHDIMVRSGSVGGMGGYSTTSRMGGSGWGQPRDNSMSALASGLPAAGLGPMGAAAAARGAVPSLAGQRPFGPAGGMNSARAYPLPPSEGGEYYYEDGESDYDSEDQPPIGHHNSRQ